VPVIGTEADPIISNITVGNLPNETAFTLLIKYCCAPWRNTKSHATDRQPGYSGI